MRKFLFVIFSAFIFLPGTAQTVKGLYVNQFSSVAENIPAEDHWKIYFSHHQLTITSDSIRPRVYSVYNATGTLVFTHECNCGGVGTDFSYMLSGLYIVIINDRSDGSVHTEKIIFTQE